MIFPLTSKRPILLVGNGARAAGAAEAIIKFSNKTDIPVLTTMNAVDIVQDENNFGFIGTYGTRVANTIVKECDLVISIGARLGLRQIGKNPSKFAPNASLIRVDIDQYELSRRIKPNETDYLMDAKEFIELLSAEDIPLYKEWYGKCCFLRDEIDGIDDEYGNLVIKKISSMLPFNPIVAVDVGQNQCWAAQSLRIKGAEGRILIAGGYGSMGCGLPFAIGASFAKNSDIVFCITGDGGLQMNIQELETLVRDKLPVKILVLNNYALGKISEVQLKSYDGRYAQTTPESGYTVPSFEKISSAYGIKSTTLENYEDLDKYKSWLEDSEPCLIDIHMPEDTLLIPKLDFSTMEIKPLLNEEMDMKIKSIFSN